MTEVIVLEKAPILIPNNEHRNFTETDKVIPVGTTLKGDFQDIEGLRRGKPFIYRLFIDKDGIIIYTKYVEERKNNMNGNDTTITLPSTKNYATTHAVVSVISGVLGYSIAKKMGKPGKTAFIVAGVSALAGYYIANQITKNQSIIYNNN